MKPRPIRVEGDIAYVPLTKGYEAIIDAEDVPLVEGWNWCAKRSGKTVYAMRKAPRDINGKQSSIHLHRVLTSAPPDLEVDHKDGNGLNNRRRGEAGNLRLATPRQNRYNQSRAKHNSSGLKGVTWSKVAKSWLLVAIHRAARETDKARGLRQSREASICEARLTGLRNFALALGPTEPETLLLRPEWRIN